MGKRGRAPAPTNLKLLRGEKHRDRINQDEPVPMAGRLDPPDDLDPAVAEVWRRLMVEIEAMGIAFPSDIEQWRMYCVAVVTQKRLSVEVLTAPPLKDGGTPGLKVRNPIFAMFNEATNTALRLAREFGLTPSARSSIEVNRVKGGEHDNPFASTGS